MNVYTHTYIHTHIYTYTHTHTHTYTHTHSSSVVKKSACNAGDLGSIPALGRSLGEGKGYPVQYSGLENSIQSTGLQRVGCN